MVELSIILGGDQNRYGKVSLCLSVDGLVVGFGAANHLAISANHNITINILHEEHDKSGQCIFLAN